MKVLQRSAAALRFGASDSGYILALLMLSLTINVFQAYTSAQRPSPELPQIAIGDQIPEVLGTSPDGAPVSIRFVDSLRPTVIYVLSPNCIWCQRNLANIQHLSSEKGAEYRFVGLSLTEDGWDQHVRDANYSGIEVYVADRASVDELRLGITPQTLVLDRDGTVVRNWLGAFSDDTGADVASYFGVDLPGLTNELVMTSRELCVDERGRRFSPGFVQESRARECGADGEWFPYFGR